MIMTTEWHRELQFLNFWLTVTTAAATACISENETLMMKESLHLHEIYKRIMIIFLMMEFMF